MEKSSTGRRSTATSRKIIATAAALWLMGTPVLTACSADDDGNESQNVYCVDNDGNLIDQSYCDDNGYYNGYPVWIWVTSTHHSVGYHIPVAQRTGGSYFRSNNTTARQNAGLARSGRPQATVRRSGGFGTSHDSGNSGRSSSNSGGSHGFGGHSSGG